MDEETDESTGRGPLADVVMAPDGTPLTLVPVGQNVLVDNENARVWEVMLDPGESHPWHRHEHPYLVLAIEQGDNRIEALDGTLREVHEAVGGVVYREPGEVHRLTNVGSTRYRSRLVELKDTISRETGKEAK